MDFQPVNSDHAVQSAAFSVAFDAPLNAQVALDLKGRSELLAELPAVQAPQGLELAFGPGGPVPAQRRFAGIQLSHLRPDGTPAWALRAFGNEIAVDCNRYTRWVKVWDAASRYLKTALEIAQTKDPKRKVSTITQAFVDVFTTNRPDYDLQSLLKKSELFSAKIFTSGNAWHCHVGWFQSDKSPKWLNQINVDAVPSAGQFLVQITHVQQLSFAPSIETADTMNIIDGKMLELHQNNKAVLEQVLSDAMIQRIKLKSE